MMCQTQTSLTSILYPCVEHSFLAEAVYTLTSPTWPVERMVPIPRSDQFLGVCDAAPRKSVRAAAHRMKFRNL